MAEFTFSCPGCGNGILCDTQWAGQQVACPTCHTAVLVPTAAATDPANDANAKAAAAAAARARLAARTLGAKKSTAKIVTYSIIGVAAAVGFFFLMKKAGSLDSSIAEKTTEAAKESGGGDLGHIASLYDVLDKTDPDKMHLGGGLSKAEEADMKRRLANVKAEMEAEMKASAKKAPELPATLASAEWNMDIESAAIPAGRINGMLSGTNFVVGTSRIDRAGYSQVLTFRQGDGAAADREIFIYLSVSPNETITNRTWTVSKDMKGKGVPQIIKRWKANPRYAPIQKTYTTGYAMKLELGAASDGYIPGKLVLSLPDNEKSVVAGEFQAETALYQTRSPAAAEYRFE
jgi:hypothetical protein